MFHPNTLVKHLNRALRTKQPPPGPLLPVTRLAVQIQLVGYHLSNHLYTSPHELGLLNCRC